MSLILPDFSVKDRIAIVTGAGRGIGLAIARVLAAGGAKVAIHDVELEIAQKEAHQINSQGGVAIAIGGDAVEISTADQIISQTCAKLGEPDLLINNLGIQKGIPFPEATLEEMGRQINTNTLFTIRMCQLAIPLMQKKQWGRIINLGSVLGKVGNFHLTSYSMSKAAIENLTKSLAQKYGKEGIRVNTLCPGWYLTHRTQNDFKDVPNPDDRMKWNPIPRVGKPEDMAGIVILLCSEAGEYITGQTIYVDGGMSIR